MSASARALCLKHSVLGQKTQNINVSKWAGLFMLSSTFFCKKHGVLENPQGKSEMHVLERTLSGRTLDFGFFKGGLLSPLRFLKGNMGYCD